MFPKCLFCVFIVSLFKFSCSLFDQCNHVVHLKAGEKIYINSPYYPGRYPVGTSCRYTVMAPVDYELSFKCDVQLNSAPAATRCLNEIFYFNREGSELLSGSEYFCGSGKMERKSFLNRAVISYISTSPHYNNNRAQLRTTTTTTTTTTTSTTTTESPNEVTENNNAFTNIRAPLNGYDTAGLELNTSTDEGIGMSNSLAYVIGLLSNTVHKGALAFSGMTPSTGSTPDGGHNEDSEIVWADVLPTILWRNSSILANAPSALRQGKIVGNGYDQGGGSFSCLVEVIEPECDCGWSTSTKVAGESQVAGINEFPSMAGVKTVRFNKIFCGASIIHHRYLLSAAHCFSTVETNRSELIQVVVGEHDLSTGFESLYTRTYDIQDIILHENFRATTTGVRNDIALLRTHVTIEWNRSVGPACLPFRSAGGTKSGRKLPKPGQRVDAAGWGTTSFGGPQSSRLLKTSLDVISNEQCRRSLTALPASTFCTYTPGRDTCQYDSGGALYLRSERLYAVGIVSYGIACATRLPSVNTKVSSFVKWIKSKTPEVRYCIK